MDKKLKVAIGAVTYPLPNGVTSSINITVDQLLARGFEVIIISPKYGPKPARPEHRQVNASWLDGLVTRLVSRKEKMFAQSARKQIQKILKDFQPDVFWLHTVTPIANVFEQEMHKLGQPCVITYHTEVSQYGRIYGGLIGEDLMESRSRALCNSVDYIITPSNITASELRRIGVTKPIEVISTGIAPMKEGDNYTHQQLCQRYNLPIETKILLSVGRVVAEKNIQVLFKAVAQVAKKHPEVRLLMVGAGDLVTAKKMVSNLSITDKVTFTDRLPYEETRKFYNGANMFVFASTTETQGLVVGEAMLGGLPIAALTSGIQKEFYPKEVAEVAATPEELPEKINYLLENPDRAKSLAHKSKEFALANFSVDVMAEKQIAVLEEVTEKDQVLESKPS